jgi:GDP-L-fucose synthase
MAKKIYVAGHTGLAGSAIVRHLEKKGFHNIIKASSRDLDLTQQNPVRDFFSQTKPEIVFLCAAKVGGILANMTYPADFIYQNLLIQTNVIHEAMQSGVRRLIFLGSSCIYPREAPQPIKEDYLLSGQLEATNRPYAVAKIAGIETCWAYNRQYNTQFLCLMPTNLYGSGDNYDLNNSHVVAALIRKMHEAKISKQKEVVVWGTGVARREFLCSDDLADAAVFVMGLPDSIYSHLCLSKELPPLLNVGFGKEVSIKDLVTIIKEIVGYEGSILWDNSKPDGTLLKLMDSSRIYSLGWKPKISLRQGLKDAYTSFLSIDPTCA